MREYFREPWGRHNCPTCHKRFKLKWSISYFSLLVLSVIVTAGIPCVLVYVFTKSYFFASIAYLVAAALFVLPIDRWLDDTWRESAEI